MGEYAKLRSTGKEIKIGTCEQMYFLRADQVHLIAPLNGSVNPRSVKQAESIRFRFPFPQEDGTAPGAFDDYDYGLGIYGIEPPPDIEHYNIQFTRNYPQSGGVVCSLPCPRSDKPSPVAIGYNGYAGPVHIHSQRLQQGKLHLVLRCGDCGALYRLDSLEECRPLLNILEHYDKDCQAYYSEVARRIVAGYTEPNFWTPAVKALEAA